MATTMYELQCISGHKSLLTPEELEVAFGYHTTVDIETGLIGYPFLPEELCPECQEMGAPMAEVIPFPMHRVSPA